MCNNSPIFVVGMPRSGTTLMSSLLSAHPNIAIAPETHFLNKWVEKYNHLDLRQPDNFDKFWKHFSASERFSLLGVNAEAVLRRIQQKGSPSFRLVFEAVLKEYASVKNKSRWGEKTPAHYDYVDILLSWFPFAHVIWMVRDPRTVCASYMNVPWSIKHVLGPARRWSKSMRALGRWQDCSRIKVVRYEDLVTNPKKTLSEVLGFLGEQATTEYIIMNQRHIPDIDAHTGWAKQHFEAASKPIHKKSLNAWREQLSENQVRLIEHVTRHWLPRYGYDPTETQNRLLNITRLVVNTASYFKALLAHKGLKFILREYLSVRKPFLTPSSSTTMPTSSGPVPTFFVWGYYGVDNVGDEAMLRIIISHLRTYWPRCEIIVTSGDPVKTEEEFDVQAPWSMRAGRRFSFCREIEFFQAAKGADVIIRGGGTFFQDYGRSWKPLILDLIRFALLRLYGKKIVITGAGAAEVKTYLGRLAVKWTVRLSDAAVFRDEQSISLLKRLGVPSRRMSLSADLAFLLPVQQKTQPQLSQIAKLKSSSCKIGVSVLSFFDKILGDENKEIYFVETIAKALDQICLNWNCELHFITVKGGAYKNDRLISEQIADKMEWDQSIHIHSYRGIDGTLDLISQMDLCIGMRLHFLIFCYLLNIPAIALSYNVKVASFMHSINADHMCITDLEQMTSTDLIQLFDKLQLSPNIYPAHDAKICHFRKLAERNFEPLARLLMVQGFPVTLGR